MPSLTDERIADVLRLAALPNYSGPLHITPEPSDPDEQRFRITAASSSCILKVYAPSARETAQREIAGLRLGSQLALAPALLLADEAGATLGGPTLIVEAPTGKPLGDSRLSADDAQRWQFLLLTLHHLPPQSVAVASSMSPDAATWWQRTQPAWEECRASYASAPFRPLLDALTRLHAIVGVHVEAHRALWQNLTRRPCHGNPVPAHLVRDGSRLMLIEWGGFGLGDPAMEVGRAAALAALSGELSADQYVQLIADYLAGMRDLRDATLEERVRVFASILPLGFCFVMLRMLSQSERDADHDRHVEQVARALIWIQDTLGVEVGAASELLAPLRVRV